MRLTLTAVVLAAGLALTAAAVALTLSHSPAALAGTNSVQADSKLSRTTGTSYAKGCQTGETLPRDTTAVRLSLFAVVGPRVTASFLADSHAVTSGTRPPGWVGSVVTIPMRPLPRTRSSVKLCFKLTSFNGPVLVIGEDTPPAEAAVSNGEALPGRIRVEYLRPGDASWWSHAGSIAQRLDFGHAAGGPWDVVLAAILASAVPALSIWAAARGSR
jgi:hypothetical protein